MGLNLSIILLGGGCLLLGLFIVVAIGIVFYLEQSKGRRDGR